MLSTKRTAKNLFMTARKIFNQAIQINEIFKTGAQHLTLEKSFADEVLNLVMAQSYDTTVKPDHGTHGKHYTERYNVAWMGKETPAEFRPVRELIANEIRPLLEPMYGPVKASEPHIYLCQQGYEMEWHDHLSQRSIVCALIYLSPDDITEDDGGHLEIGQFRRNDQGEAIQLPKQVKRYCPKHGDVILLESQSPFFQHRCNRFHPDKKRFFMSISIGSEVF